MYIICSTPCLLYYSAASLVCTYGALTLKVNARVCCHISHHLTLWTVINSSLRLSPDTNICQSEIINTIISPMLALYSVSCFKKMWLCLFISEAWISERPLIRLFHYALLSALREHAKNCVFAGLGLWCPICKATKICHYVLVKKIHILFLLFKNTTSSSTGSTGESDSADFADMVYI